MGEHPRDLEVEVKFLLDFPEAIREKLLADATLVQPKAFESNLRYDNASHALIRQSKLLRLRRDRECRLTFKGRPSEQSEHQDQYKIHRELEVSVSDCDTMDALLQELGFKVVQIYEKWREIFAFAGALICLDTMPFGHFLEIEGSGRDIRAAAHRLGFDWEDRILDNYLNIFEVYRKRAGLPFSDVTFDNFRGHPVQTAQLRSMLRKDGKRTG